MSLSRLPFPVRICLSCLKLNPSNGRPIYRRGLSTSALRYNEDDDLNPLKTNPYFKKYSRKITDMQKTTPEELERRITAFREKKGPRQPEVDANNNLNQGSTFTKRKTLYDIMHKDLLQDKSTEEITEIWLKHHASFKDTFSVVISAETFKENAPECLALTHFAELIEEKGVVLLRGEYNHDVLDISEAMCLANQLHRYYGEFDIQRHKLLERFTNAPTEFRHMDLVVELERMVKRW